MINNINLPGFTPWLVLTLALVTTLFSWQLSDENEINRAKVRFHTESSEHVAAIRHRMETYEQALRGGVALFNSSNDVTRNEWKIFAESLRVKQNFPGIQGYGWSIFVRPEEVVAHTAQIRAEGFPNYHIKPTGERELYSTIVFLEPFDLRNQQAFGYDMFAQWMRRAAMERTRDTGQATMSGRVTLVQEIRGKVQAGMLMYLPVYKKNQPTNTIQERQAAIIGFVYAPFRMDDLMKGILGDRGHLVSLHIFDGKSKAEPDLMYNSEEIFKVEKKPAFQEVKVVEIAGREWTLEFTGTPKFNETIDHSKPLFIAIGGIIGSLLLFGFVHGLARSHSRAVVLAEQMTAGLVASEGRANAVLTTALDGIITIDMNGIVQSFNPAAERIFGYVTDETIGHNIKMLMPEPYHSAHDGYLDNFIRTGEFKIIGSVREVVGKRKNGDTFPMKLAVSQDIENKRFVGIVSDISAEKAADLAKRDFVSTVSHELRTPITAISGMLKLILGIYLKQLPEKTIPMLQTADNNCDRLIRLINDILDMEKIAAGKMEFKVEEHDMVVLLKQEIEHNQGYADKNGVTLTLNEELPEQALAVMDADRFAQVMANLISNAVKFSPKSEPVEVSLIRQDSKIHISVKDQGPGISKSFQSRIFQKFSQASSGDTRKTGGTGLGLVICKQIMEKLGGEIGFHTEEGGGTTFFITIPTTEPLKQNKSNLPHLLYVEDEPGIAEMVTTTLNRVAEVSVVPTLAGARRYLAQNSFALILLDLNLIDGTVNELLPITQTSENPAKVIVFSASKAPVKLPNGVDQWLVKSSTSNEQLLKIIKSLLVNNAS